MNMEFVLQNPASFPVGIWLTGPSSSYQGLTSVQPYTLHALVEDDNDHIVTLYAQGSRSIPWQTPQNKWSHLNPQWRFIDLSGNQIDHLTLTTYASVLCGSTIGYRASNQFYYIDDMPTFTGSPVIIRATMDFSEYPVQIDTSDTMPNVKGHSNSMVSATTLHAISSLIPYRLSITRDGISDLFAFYWNNIQIPYVISVEGIAPNNETSIMYHITASSAIYRNIPDLPLSAVNWTPPISSTFLSAVDSGGFYIGGYVQGIFSSKDAKDTVFIYASSLINHNSTNVFLSGQSVLFDLYDFNGYDIRRFNESWDAAEYVKELARSPHIANNPNLWGKYMRAVWGDASTEQGESFGREAYEKIANYVKNHADVNTCNVAQLYNLAQFTDVPIDVYGLQLPVELRRLMDIASVNQQILWGERCNCNRNYDNSYTTYVSAGIEVPVNKLCKECNHSHPGNRGKLFNPDTYMVSAFVPFIIEDREKHKNKYTLIIPPASCISNTSNSIIADICIPVESISNCITTYPLSSYYMYLLPIAEGTSFEEANTFFCYYDYVDHHCTEQVAGVINWDDPYTTINESASSIEEWYGEGQILERMFNYVLHKGLGLIND